MAKVMYVGPARPLGLPIGQYAVLDAPPEASIPDLAAPLEKEPALRQLFVPLSEVPEARRAVATPGEPLNRIYKNIAAKGVK